MNSSGNNLNAGTTCSDVGGGSNSPDYTSVGGNFDGVSLFTPTDGSTPASFIAVGDWVSLYNTGDTACRTIAKVTVVAAGVNGAVTVDTTNKFGTVPTSNSGSRALRHGGALADLGIVATNAALNTGTAPVSIKINNKFGTYANTTNSRLFSLTGTATVIVWWDGYKTTPGDLDARPTSTRTPGTDMPTWTWTTGSVFNPGSNVRAIFSNIDFTSASITVGTLNIASGAVVTFERCRFTNTGANALSAAASFASGTQRFVECYFNALSTATTVIKNTTGTVYMIGCTVTGGGIGFQCTTGSAYISNTQFNVASHAMQHTGAPTSFTILSCSAYFASGGDFYNFTAAPTAALVADNEINNFTNAINNTSGTNTDVVVRDGNSWLAASEVGMGDIPNFNGFTESSLPFNSTSDLTLLSTASGYKNGLPSLFENSTTHTYGSVGAAEPQPSGGINRSLLPSGLSAMG